MFTYGEFVAHSPIAWREVLRTLVPFRRDWQYLTRRHFIEWRRVAFHLHFLAPDERARFGPGYGQWVWPWRWHRTYFDRWHRGN